jgi:glycosyltransferase involved in cell wall biosynthesis
MRLLGIKIHGGYTSEARVFATLLGHRRDAFEARVIYHRWDGADSGAEAFARDARVELDRVDVALRPRRIGSRSHGAAAKLLALARFRASFPMLLDRARRYQPDVIYSSQQLWDCAVASYLARRLKRPQVIHLHYVIGPWLRTGFSDSGRALLAAMRAFHLDDPLDRMAACERVITVSDFIRGNVIEHGIRSERVTTVRNAIRPVPPPPAARQEARQELGLAPDAQVIGIVGRLDPDKGQEDTLEAFVQLAAESPSARLVIVGEGPRRVALERRAKETDLADRVLLTGQRGDVPRLLAAMDLFCHPSRRDPCPLATLEASAAGLPVVAYAEAGTGDRAGQRASPPPESSGGGPEDGRGRATTHGFGVHTGSRVRPISKRSVPGSTADIDS